MKQLKPLGWHTARMAEASDAGSMAQYRVDGKDGDVAFPPRELETNIYDRRVRCDDGLHAHGCAGWYGCDEIE